MAGSTLWSLVAETCEWVGPISVTADDVPVTEFEIAVTGPGARPTAWAAPTVLSGASGVLVGTGTPHPLVPGTRYTVWVRFVDVPETPVERVGYIKAF